MRLIVFSRERLRRVLRKKTSADLYFTSSHLHLHIVSSTSSHLHLCTSTFSPVSLLIFTCIHNCTSTSLLTFTSSHLHLTSLPLIFTSHLHLTSSPLALLNFLSYGRGQYRRSTTKRSPLRRSCVSSARNAGESAIWFCRGQPSAEIVRVECAKCRRECDLRLSGATLSGDRACRVREMQARVRCGRDNPLRRSCASSARNAEMQARVRFDPVRENPLRRWCVSSERNAGESGPGEPSAEIVRVECATCRRECDLDLSGATLCGTVDFVVQL